MRIPHVLRGTIPQRAGRVGSSWNGSIRFPGTCPPRLAAKHWGGACGNPPDHGGGLWSGGRQFHRDSPPAERLVPQLDRFLPGAAACAANPAGLRTRLLPERRSRLLHRLCERPRTMVGTPRPSPFPFARRPVERKRPDGQRGIPFLIDPAVYFGDREVDLAFSEMFGGFPYPFYDAYNEAFPLAPGFSERNPFISSIIFWSI